MAWPVQICHSKWNSEWGKSLTHVMNDGVLFILPDTFDTASEASLWCCKERQDWRDWPCLGQIWIGSRRHLWWQHSLHGRMQKQATQVGQNPWLRVEKGQRTYNFRAMTFLFDAWSVNPHFKDASNQSCLLIAAQNGWYIIGKAYKEIFGAGSLTKAEISQHANGKFASIWQWVVLL